LYIINLIGSKKDINQTTYEMKKIAEVSFGLSTETVSIKPYCLSSYPTNTPAKWRTDLSNILLSSNKDVIINKVGLVNCEEITDLKYSVVALNPFCRPFAFLIDSNAESHDKSELQIWSSQCDQCTQINQTWIMNAPYSQKIRELNLYLNSYNIKN